MLLTKKALKEIVDELRTDLNEALVTFAGETITDLEGVVVKNDTLNQEVVDLKVAITDLAKQNRDLSRQHRVLVGQVNKLLRKGKGSSAAI